MVGGVQGKLVALLFSNCKYYFQLPKQDPENPSPTCSAFKASKQAVKIKRRRVSKGKGKWSSSRDKFKVMQNPRCKKASLCWLNLQHTCHTTIIPPSYFTLQKGSRAALTCQKCSENSASVQLINKKRRDGHFSSFSHRISFLSDV